MRFVFAFLTTVLALFFVNFDTKNSYEVLEVFSDSLNIGAKEKNKIDLKHFVTNNDESNVSVHFFSRKGKKWILLDKFIFEKDRMASCDPELLDYNNDGFLDFTYISNIAARGSNEVRRLFLYNPRKDRLQEMKNSESFPNLQYNKKLNCVTSHMYHGGSTTVFLKIEKDSLRMFASVDNSNEQVVTLYDAKGKATEISRKPLDIEDLYYRYENYNPVE